METNKELQSRGFGLQRRLASTDTYDITKILSRGGKGKSFTMIFLFGAPGDENVCNFLLRRDRWKNPTMFSDFGLQRGLAPTDTYDINSPKILRREAKIL